MFLTAQDIAHSREHSLNNLLGMSSACIQAGQRFSELLSNSSRETMQHNSRHWNLLGHGQLDALTQFPATLWLESAARNSQLLDAAYEILGEAHKALIRNAEAQVRVFDEIVFASIRRLENSSPWEAEIALDSLRNTLTSAEHTLQGMSEAAIETVEIAEQQVHQISESLGETKPARKRAASRQTT